METEAGGITQKKFLRIALIMSQPESPVNVSVLLAAQLAWRHTSITCISKHTSLCSIRGVLPLWSHAAAELGVERTDFITKYMERQPWVIHQALWQS